MTEDPYGNWVDLVEHDHLKAECDALRAENERLRKVTHVMIPTDTMEQEFAKYHRRGFDAGIKQGLAENAELVAALEGLLCASGSHNCITIHHSKADQHAYTEVCKPLVRYELALDNARAALAKHRGYATQPIDKP